MRMNKIVASALAFALCGAPELIKAQQPQPALPSAAPSNRAPQPAQPSAPAGSTATPNATQPNETQKTNGVTVDPSQAPLQPVPAETPVPPDLAEPATKPPAAPADSSSQTMPQSDQPQTQNLPANPEPQKPQKPEEPVGAAAAEKGRTAGGAASKPAGTAIAPAKQGQVRSWLIRIGAIAAAGAAFGTVYALSRKTPSTPPGTQTLGPH